MNSDLRKGGAPWKKCSNTLHILRIYFKIGCSPIALPKLTPCPICLGDSLFLSTQSERKAAGHFDKWENLSPSFYLPLLIRMLFTSFSPLSSGCSPGVGSSSPLLPWADCCSFLGHPDHPPPQSGGPVSRCHGPTALGLTHSFPHTFLVCPLC